jgi:hypothetical protein
MHRRLGRWRAARSAAEDAGTVPHLLDHRTDLNSLWAITIEHYVTSPVELASRRREHTLGVLSYLVRARSTELALTHGRSCE